MALGIRLLVFIPFMVLAAVLSGFLPEVQVEDMTGRGDTEAATIGHSLRRLKNKTGEEIAPNPRTKIVKETAINGQNGVQRVNENQAINAQAHTAQASVGQASRAQVSGSEAPGIQASGAQASGALPSGTPTITGQDISNM